MSASLDVIKSYLVSLGFSVNNTEYEKAKRVIEDMTKTVATHTGLMSSNYVKAAGIVVGSIETVNAAIAGMLYKVSQADLGYQKLALRMYLADSAAKQLKITTDAIGESLDDIAWLPELRGRYQQLMRESQGMETPGGAAGQLRYLRDIRFEFQRLRVEGVYAMQWIAYHMFTLNRGEAKDMRQWLDDMNNKIQKNMPVWTAKVAGFLQVFVALARDLWRLATDLYGSFETLWSSLGKGQKAFAALAAFLTAFFLAGPLGQAIIRIGMLILVLDDFYAYIDGRKSSKALAPIWNMLISAADTLVRLMVSAAVAADALTNKKSIKQAWTEAKTAFKEIPGVLGEGGALDQRRNQAGASPAGSPGNWMSRTAKQESGGNYNAVSPLGARGKYQIMPQNWGPWATEAGLGANAPMTPENQEIVTRFKYQQYFNKYRDDQLVSAAWYGGPGTADRLRRGDMAALNIRPKGGGPSVGEYITSVSGYQYGGNQGGTTINMPIDVGGVHVTNPGATKEDIYWATMKGIQDATRREAAYLNRDARGPYN